MILLKQKEPGEAKEAREEKEAGEAWEMVNGKWVESAEGQKGRRAEWLKRPKRQRLKFHRISLFIPGIEQQTDAALSGRTRHCIVK